MAARKKAPADPFTAKPARGKKDEHDIKDQVHQWLKEQPKARLWFLKIHGNHFQRANIPDYLLCVRGRFVAVELKQPGEHPTVGQQKEIDWVNDAGGVALCCTSLEQFIELVRSLAP